MYVCTYVCMYVFLFVCLSSVCLSVCLSVYLSSVVCLSVSVSFFVYVYHNAVVFCVTVLSCVLLHFSTHLSQRDSTFVNVSNFLVSILVFGGEKWKSNMLFTAFLMPG